MSQMNRLDRRCCQVPSEASSPANAPMIAVSGHHEMRDQCERAAEPEKGCTGHFRAAPKIGQLATIPHHWSIDPPRPDRWDAVGVALALMGAGLVLYAPRSG